MPRNSWSLLTVEGLVNCLIVVVLEGSEVLLWFYDVVSKEIDFLLAKLALG